MTDSHSRHVVPRRKGKQWAVIKGGVPRASGVYSSKSVAVARAITIVKNLGGGVVYIHDRDGRIDFHLEVE